MQFSQWFTTPSTGQAQGFMPIITGFTPTPSKSELVTSWSMSASFSELICHPTPSELQVPMTTMAAPVPRIETIPSSGASTELPPVVRQPPPPSLSEALVKEPEAVVLQSQL